MGLRHCGPALWLFVKCGRECLHTIVCLRNCMSVRSGLDMIFCCFMMCDFREADCGGTAC